MRTEFRIGGDKYSLVGTLGALEGIAETDEDLNLYMVAANMAIPRLFNLKQLVAIFVEGLRAAGEELTADKAIEQLGVYPASKIAVQFLNEALKHPEDKNPGNVLEEAVDS